MLPIQINLRNAADRYKCKMCCDLDKLVDQLKELWLEFQLQLEYAPFVQNVTQELRIICFPEVKFTFAQTMQYSYFNFVFSVKLVPFKQKIISLLFSFEQFLLHFNLNRYRLEVLLFKLEILDHKARERAGAITPTFIGPVPVLLQLDTAMEVKPHIKWKPYLRGLQNWHAVYMNFIFQWILYLIQHIHISLLDPVQNHQF